MTSTLSCKPSLNGFFASMNFKFINQNILIISILFLFIYLDKSNGVTKQLNGITKPLNGINIIKKVNNNKDKKGQLYDKWDSNINQ